MPSFGICTSPENSAALQAAGFDYVEGNCQAYFRGKESNDDYPGPDAYCGDSVLPIPVCNLLVPGDLRIVGPDRDSAALHDYMKNLLHRASQAGVDTVVFGSGAARGIPEGFSRELAKEQILDFLRDAAPMAERQGVTIVAEPLNRGECNILNSVGEAMGYVQAVGSDGFQCLVDSYHFWLEEESLGTLENAMGSIRHVHVADRDGRVAPGESGDVAGMYREFFAVLKRGGYDGRISVEGKVEFEEAALQRTLGFLKEQWSAA